MKKLYTLIASVVITSAVFAQAPSKMSYQAVVRDAGDALVISQAVGMQLSIVQDSASGTVVYVETQTPTSNLNGLVSVEIGSGTVVSGTFNSIDWSKGLYFIKTETDPTGGTMYTITGTSELMSVPYALHANTADSIIGGATQVTAGTNVIVTGSGKTASPYVINATGGSTDKFYLGQDTLGGIVYFIYKDATGAQHGLIVNKTESTAVWQASGTLTNANRTEDGAFNTALMTSSAAATYVTGLGAGWYLPSIDELGLLYDNRFSANKALRAGSFTLLSTGSYWSSTEYGTTHAYKFYFSDGGAFFNRKSTTHSVRAVRAF